MGSGFKIAMRSIDPWAGNIRASQSGFTSDSSWFEMYSQLLEEAIAKNEYAKHRRQKLMQS